MKVLHALFSGSSGNAPLGLDSKRVQIPKNPVVQNILMLQIQLCRFRKNILLCSGDFILIVQIICQLPLDRNMNHGFGFACQADNLPTMKIPLD